MDSELNTNKEIEHNPVVSDIHVFKKSVSTVSSNLGNFLKLHLKLPDGKVKRGIDNFLSSENSSESLRKLIKLVFVLGILVFILFVALSVFRLFFGSEETPNTTNLSPSPVVYQQVKDSIWAKDADILKLETDLNVLEKEILNSQIKDKSLLPPSLDFNVNFKK
jgi:hypothetical protein